MEHNNNVKCLDAIEDHIKQLKNKNLSNNSLIHTLDHLEESLNDLQNIITDHERVPGDTDYFNRRIEDSAILLWNLTVVRKSADLPPKLDARMRQVACDIMTHVKKVDPNVDTYYKRRLQMTVKTAKSWLSCGEPRLADVLVQQAVECIGVLRQFVERQCERGLEGGADRERALVKLDEDLMKVHLYRAEACCMLEKFEAANSELDLAERLLDKHPHATCILAILCYNMGVACYHKHQYHQAVTFLRRAVQLGRDVDHVQQGRTLRLLVNCYLDLDEVKYRSEALEAVDMANEISVHPSGLYLRIRILILDPGADERRLSTAIHTLMDNPQLSSDVAYKATEILLKNQKPSLALKLMRRFVERFPHCVEVVRIYAHQMAILVSWREFEQAEHVAGDYLKVVAEKSPREEDAEACEEIWRMCKDTAALFMMKDDYQRALKWFDHCVRVKSRDTDQKSRDLDQASRDEKEEVSLARVHRDRATCFLHTEQLEKAWQAVELAERHEPTSPANQYLKLKVALARFDGNSASDAFLKMCQLLDQSEETTEEQTNGLISLTAQFALEPGWRGSVIMALKSLIGSSSNLYQVIISLHCLLKLYHQNSGPDNVSLVLWTMQTAHDKLKAYHENLEREKREDSKTRFLEEVDWFVKTAWNMAVRCSENMTEMFDLYTICSKLIDVRGEHVEEEWLVRQQTCAFMAAAAALDLAKKEVRIEEKRSWLEKALFNVNQCSDIQNKLQGNSACTSDSTVTELVLLLEFETKAWLRDPDMERTFIRARSMENIQPKTLERMAVVCQESRCADKSLYQRILYAAIERHKKQDEPDFVQISKLFLFLIDGSLNEKLPGNKSRDTAWKQYSQLLEILPESGDKFPEIDLVSFMSRAWNVGQDMMGRHNMEEAEKWSSLGLKLIQYLRDLKPAHEPKMNQMYGELLKTFKRTKGFEE